MSGPVVIREAAFDTRVKPYFMLSSILICAATIVGIVLIPVVLVVGFWIIQKYLDNLSCTLTDRTLELNRGILTRTESTIPLDKITDLQMYQGPVMRVFGLRGFKVETAGQSARPGSLVSIIGIVDAAAFRAAVLSRRDAIAGGGDARAAAPAGPATTGDPVLIEIRDSLLRIEKRLDEDA